jgi:glyoxylase-like metal-dependent hydrolase (beta-lactamase superfamily II)
MFSIIIIRGTYMYPTIEGSIENWDIIVIGHLRVNTFFGETYENPPRGYPSTCTSTMVRGYGRGGEPYVLLIDPTIRATPGDYDFDINRRTGLRLGDVTHCFCTHHHADHFEALPYFPRAAWYAEDGVAELIRNEPAMSRVAGVRGEFLPGVAAVHLPGHTENLHGVAFCHRGKRILAAGDAVMSKYHFDAETTDFQKDPSLVRKAADTIREMKTDFDVVIPGHDNAIFI